MGPARDTVPDDPPTMSGRVKPAPGVILDARYRLVSRLGRGGFGDVWRAEELLPDGAPFREVALKLLAATGDETSWAEEAKLLASFRHESLVTIYAAGILAGSPPVRFVAMELLEGQSLAELLKARGRIPWRRVARWAASVAHALDVIHRGGVVHLDLKPANLFLCGDGAVKVLDFGIARRSGAHPIGRFDSLPPVVTARSPGLTMGARPQAPGATPAARRSGPTVPTAAGSIGELATEMFVAAAVSIGELATAVFIPPDAPARLLAVAIDATALAPVSPAAGFDAAAPPGPSHRPLIVGTPGFMAPEVLEQSPPTAAADAYALAVCVAQLTTGSLPHAVADEPDSWDDPSLVSAWLSELRLATLRGTLRDFDADTTVVPRGLAALIRRLLAVAPEDRGVLPGRLGELFEEAWHRPHGVADPPYFGLDPFPPEGEGLLFGRDDEIARLGRELEYEPAVVLQGARGAGKSSLAAAGLVPYLAQRGVDGKDDWIAARVDPGADPDAALAAALAAIAPTLADADGPAIARFCAASEIGVVLLVDPLESALDAAPEKRARLDALMLAVAEESLGPPPPDPSAPPLSTRAASPTSTMAPGLRLVAALAEEHTNALLDLGPLGARLRAALRYIGAPAAAAARDIVAAPAHFAGVALLGVDAVATEVQRELRAGASNTPYIALALRTLWSSREKREGRSVIPAERWQELGGVRGALAHHADRVLAEMDRHDRPIAEELLLRLSATDGTRIRWDEAELVAALAYDPASTSSTTSESARKGADLDADLPRAADIVRVLARLDAAFLVRRDKDAVEIGHDALLAGWPQLASLRLAQMGRLVFLERLREAALAWERADEHADLLLPSAMMSQLARNGAWAARGLAPRERELVRRSRARARVRLATRLGIAAMIGLIPVGGIVAERSIQQARREEARVEKEESDLKATADLTAKARGAMDPYPRAAFAAAAMDRGGTDAMLPLDLAAAARDTARAEFLTFDRITAPVFPWDDRWLLAQGSPTTLVIVDFRPDDPEARFDAPALDPESEDERSARPPRLLEIRPHVEPIAERVPFAFDTSFATRSVTGELKVFRLRPDGSVALAALAPFRCTGAVRVAEAAPVLACPTDEGVVRWDLRRARELDLGVQRDPFPGVVADVSADGARVAAIEGHRVLLWQPCRDASACSGRDAARAAVHVADAPVALAKWSPREPILAVIEPSAFEIVDLAHPDAVRLRAASDVDPVSARWDERGLDLAICDADGTGRWRYLKRGGRATDDALPAGRPCVKPHRLLVAAPPPTGTDPTTADATTGDVPALAVASTAPQRIRSASELEDIAALGFGPHPIVGGFRLGPSRWLSHDLVLFRAPLVPSGVPSKHVAEAAAARLLRFRGKNDLGDDDPHTERDSAVAVVRDESSVAFQIGEEVRLYTLPEGNRLFARRGNLLRRCADARLLAWQADGDRYRFYNVWTGGEIASAPREPGFLLGADAACTTLYTQRIDGTILATPLDEVRREKGTHSGGLSAPRVIAKADGYIYDVRPSPARGTFGPGLLLASSSGAIVRVDDGSHVARVMGYATPFATALADGPEPGEVAYADATGVAVLTADGASRRLLDASGEQEWSDLTVSPDRGSMLLATVDRIAALDLGRQEVLGSLPMVGMGRFARWDEEGSVLVWSFDHAGGAAGQVIPRGVGLARAVAAAVSNLGVDGGRLVLRR